MNKQQIIDNIARQANTTKATATRVLDAFTEVVCNALEKGTDIRLAGFGSFTVSKRSARLGRNPQTGTQIEIPSSIVPLFRASKRLKDRLNGRRR